MIEDLLLTAPHILMGIKRKMIGGDGIPDNDGDAIAGLVKYAEKKYDGVKGEYWYRFMKPDDDFVGGTSQDYYGTWTTATRMGIVGTAAATVNTVPTREMIVCFGWYCEVDLGYKGYLEIDKHTVDKSEIPARIVYRQQDPDHLFVDLDKIIYGVENEKFNFITFNGLGFDMAGIVYPILYRIAPRAALNLEKQMV